MRCATVHLLVEGSDRLFFVIYYNFINSMFILSRSTSRSTIDLSIFQSFVLSALSLSEAAQFLSLKISLF